MEHFNHSKIIKLWNTKYFIKPFNLISNNSTNLSASSSTRIKEVEKINTSALNIFLWTWAVPLLHIYFNGTDYCIHNLLCFLGSKSSKPIFPVPANMKDRKRNNHYIIVTKMYAFKTSMDWCKAFKLTKQCDHWSSVK